MRRDYLVDHIYQALPAMRARDIAETVSESTGYEVSVAMIECTLSHVRANAQQYGWTVPHVKRGVPLPGEEERFFAIPYAKDPSHEMLDDDSRLNMHNGMVSTVSSIASMCRNEVAAMRAAAHLVQSKTAKRKLLAVCDDLEFVGRKSDDVAAELAA